MSDRVQIKALLDELKTLSDQVQPVDRDAEFVERLLQCCVCGTIPSEAVDEMWEPTLEVEAENFGVPWLFRLTCGICGRVVRATKTKELAFDAWNAGQVDDFVELDGED